MIKLGISGRGESGKDTVSQWFKNKTILKYEKSTSEAAAEHVFQEMRKLGHNYNTPMECWLDRKNHRVLWGELIREFGTKLYDDVVVENDIINGVRRKVELDYCKDAGLVELTIWIERKEAPPDPSLDYGSEEADIIIENNGSLEELGKKLQNLADAFCVSKI